MFTKRMIITVILLASLFTLAVGVSYAQGRNGNGNGPGGPTDPSQGTACLGDAQQHAYQHGGIGFYDPESGACWDDRGRGNMRGSRGAGGNGIGFYAALPPAVEGDVPDAAVSAMTSGLMDEYNAYGIYAAVVAQFGEVAPFVNIQRAEAQHIAAWEFLFDRYGLELPEAPQPDVPVFATLADACQAAADAEIANFGLYDTMLNTLSAYPDMVQVVTALRNASQYNHLPAFENCAG